MKIFIKKFLYIILGLYVLGLFFNIGLMVPSRKYGATTLESIVTKYKTVPKSLPTPLYNYLEKTTAAKVPDSKSAVVWGRAKIKYSGSWAQVRFKTSYLAGHQYLRIMEVTWFGFPVTKVIESFNEQNGIYKIGANFVTGNEVDRDNRISLWSDGIWMPTIYLNPKLWSSKSPTEAILNIPGSTSDKLTYKFNDQQLVSEIRGQKYKYDKQQILTEWKMKIDSWGIYEGILLPSNVSIYWGADQKPWAIFEIEGVVYQDGPGLWRLEEEDQAGS